MCTETRVRRHGRTSDTGASKGTDTHTQIPTDIHAGTGMRGSFLILHKAGLLRGAPRHRGPLLTKPPAGFKSDPPSRLQRGQGTRLPCPPPPPRSAPLLRFGRGPGCPQRRAGSTCACPRPPRPLCSRASRASVGTPGAEDTAGPGAVRRSRTQRPACGVRMPDPMGARSGGRPSRPLFLAGLSFPGAEAHSAQTGQGPVPAGHGLLTPGRVPQPPKVAYIPAINPVSFALSSARPPRPWGHRLLPLPLIANPARPGIVPTPRHDRFLTPNHPLNSMSPAARPHLSGLPQCSQSSSRGPFSDLRSPVHPLSATSEAFPDPHPQIWSQIPLPHPGPGLWQVLGQQPFPLACRSPSFDPRSQPSPQSTPDPGRRPHRGWLGWGTGGRQLSPVRPTSADGRGLPRAATAGRRRPLVEPLLSPPSVKSLSSLRATPLSAEALQNINNKEGKKREEKKRKKSFHSPTPKSIFQGGGAEGFVSKATQTSAKDPRGARPGGGRPGPHSGDQRSAGSSSRGAAGSPPAGGRGGLERWGGGQRRHYLTWSRRLIPAQGYEAHQ